MKKITFCVVTFFTMLSCQSPKENTNTSTDATENSPNFGIVLHGGAGTISKKYMSDSLEMVYNQVLEKAIRTGYEVLEKGGTSMEAVTKTINILEDSPLFNAGKGAVFTHEETNELDASVMDGKTLNAGAVAGVKRIKNPIDLAVSVMNDSPHVMLVGEGAETFAKTQGFDFVEQEYFFVQDRYNALQRIKKTDKTQLDHDAQANIDDPITNDYKYGTVGAAALDKHGNLAAGTSTGGMTNKRWGRVGDAPIIGAGTYANNATCAVSATGWGEFFMRSVVAYDISALMEYKGLSLEAAAREVIQKKVPELGGDGGIIAIDKDGNIVMEFNTEGMYRASMNAKGELQVAMYKD